MRRINIVLTILIMVGCVYGDLCFAKQEESPLVLTISAETNRIDQHTSLLLVVSLKNQSDKALHVLPLQIGTMDFSRGAATLKLHLKPPSGKTKQITYMEPYFGPMKEAEAKSVEYVLLQPGETLTEMIDVSGSWGTYKQTTVFDVPGEYVLWFTYTLAQDKNEGSNAAQILSSNRIRLRVAELSDLDRRCWEDIKTKEQWWLLYDVNMRNEAYLTDTQFDKGMELFNALERKHPNSFFARRIKYARCAFRMARATRKGKDVDEHDITTMTELASDPVFSHRKYAKDMLEKHKKIKKKLKQ